MLLDGRYEIGERLGAGGSAEVFRAHDANLGRDVAVKLLSEIAAHSADPAALQRFEVEARHAATFVHPNAVTIYDAGTDQGYLYIVMELVTGGSLAQRIAVSPMTAAEVRSIGLQLAGALEAAHSAGIIHRDVKPSNVLLDDDGNAKLADFGIARRLDEIEESMTAIGMVMGSRSYVSPEQAAGQTLGPATDVYSLGVTLYEAATGQRPPAVTERTPGHLLDPSTVVPGFDAAVARVIASASALPIEHRFASAAAFSAAIADSAGATETMPIHLRPTAPIAPTEEMSAPQKSPLLATALAAPSGSALSRELAGSRKRRSAIAATAAVLVVLGAAGIAFALARPDAASSDPATSSPITGSVLDQQEPIPAPSEPPAVESPAVESVPPTVEPEPAPTDPPAPSPDELIPGFPVPADDEEFLAILESDPELVGTRGPELAKEFAKVLDGPRGRERSVDRLRDQISKWTQDGEIDPVIAQTALDFLERLDDNDDDDGDD